MCVARAFVFRSPDDPHAEDLEPTQTRTFHTSQLNSYKYMETCTADYGAFKQFLLRVRPEQRRIFLHCALHIITRLPAKETRIAKVLAASFVSMGGKLSLGLLPEPSLSF